MSIQNAVGTHLLICPSSSLPDAYCCCLFHQYYVLVPARPLQLSQCHLFQPFPVDLLEESGNIIVMTSRPIVLFSTEPQSYLIIAS
jgi:hypothetical protein